MTLFFIIENIVNKIKNKLNNKFSVFRPSVIIDM